MLYIEFTVQENLNSHKQTQKTPLCLVTKANDIALKRQFPSGDVRVAAISGSRGRSSGTSDIAILSVGKPTWPRSGKVLKTAFHQHIFFPKCVRILKLRPRLQLYVQSVFEINRCSF